MNSSDTLASSKNLININLYNIIQETILGGKEVKLKLDYLNERVKVISYHRDNIELLVKYLNTFQNEFGKVIVVAQDNDWQDFLAHGYILEGVNSGFFSGRPGFYLANFLKTDRSISTSLVDEDTILQEIMHRRFKTQPPQPPPGYFLRNAVPSDVYQITLLYGKVFSSYPSPITETVYVRRFLNKNLFKLVLHHGKLVCAAAAEIDQENMIAELTDCACLPEYRGQGLMSYVIYILEQELIKCGFRNLYSIARAKSYGINTVFRKMGYVYGGRLINNCTICGQFEDMNLWVKNTGGLVK